MKDIILIALFSILIISWITFIISFHRKRRKSIRIINEELKVASSQISQSSNSPIIIDYLQRGQGKSIRICYLSEMLNASIVVPTVQSRNYIEVQAKTLGINIGEIYTMSEIKHGKAKGQKVVVDDWNMYSTTDRENLCNSLIILGFAIDATTNLTEEAH